MDKLQFIKYTGYKISKGGQKAKKALFKCYCGKEFETAFHKVKSGHTKSCGCLRGNNLKTLSFRHGLYGTPLYSVWGKMLQRCLNANCKEYKHYGGRGIKVCDEWLKSAVAFYEDMKDGYKKGLQLDRKNNNDNYYKENCRWVTKKQNQRNKRSNVVITYNNNSYNMSEFCEIFNLNYNVFRDRISKGWSVDKCMVTPIRKFKRK